MTENNDKLLENFFAENRQEVADNGFSRRVMHRLPNRNSRLARLWTAGGFTLAAVLFVLMDGLQLREHPTFIMQIIIIQFCPPLGGTPPAVHLSTRLEPFYHLNRDTNKRYV